MRGEGSAGVLISVPIFAIKSVVNFTGGYFYSLLFLFFFSFPPGAIFTFHVRRQLSTNIKLRTSRIHVSLKTDLHTLSEAQPEAACLLYICTKANK